MKKLWLVPIGIAVIGFIGGGVYIWKTKTSVQLISPGGEKVATVSPTPMADLTTWTDDAGFSFQYPKNLSVNKHEEDQDNYAHVELTDPAHPGKVIVWVKDLPRGVADVDGWVKSDPMLGGGVIVDSTLGGQAAKKILVTAPTKMLTIGAISDSLLFSVEGTLTDSAYWEQVQDTIVKSFAFTDTTSVASAPGVQSGGDTGSAADEQEILQ